MDFNHYLTKFKKAAARIDQIFLRKHNLEAVTGIILDSVFLKLFKSEWASDAAHPLTAESRIFFSVWVNDAIIKEQKLYYNIHALKLRKLPGHKIESRKFAEAFRAAFKEYESQWPNVSTNFGPLTLMEGWVKVDEEDEEDLQEKIIELADSFLTIEHLVDEVLHQFKK